MSIEELAEEHWKRKEDVLRFSGIKGATLTLCGYLYKTAFIHGGKHAIEDDEWELYTGKRPRDSKGRFIRS